MSAFQGESFHTSRWPADADLANKTVAVVGTGCSAAQVIPEVAKTAKKLCVFQRSPCWCVPRGNTPTSPELRAQILGSERHVERMRAEVLEWFDTELYPMFQDRDRNKAQAAKLRANLMAVVKDPEVAEKLCPTYDVGCKRNVVSDDYWPTFNRSNVTLVAEGGVARVDSNGVITRAGNSFPVDVIVYATGFDAFTGAFRNFEVQGVDKKRLLDHWKDGPRTLYGIHVHGFPNMFLMIGPQSPTILTNTTEVVLQQSEYLLALIKRTRENASSKNVDASASAEEAWVQFCKSHYPDSVWSRCDNWYNKQSQGKQGPGSEGGGSVDGFIGKYRDYASKLDPTPLQ